MKQKQINEMEYILEPPDGGWGYMIAIGMCVMLACHTILSQNFGIIFLEILNDSQDSISAIVVINSLFGIFSSVVGLITNKVLTDYPPRGVGIIGSFIYCSGSFLNIYVGNIYQLGFTYGCLQGIGFGLMNPVIFANITYYFTKKRGMINSLCLAIISAIAFMFPMIIQQMKSYYGQFGTMMVLAALSLHTMVAMILMQPVEWHLVKRLRYENEAIQKPFTDNEDITVNAGSSIVTPLPTPRNTKIFNVNKDETRIQNQIFQKALDIKIQQYRESQLSLWQKISKTLDISILKEIRVSIVIVGLAATVVADVTFVCCVPLFLYHHSFDISQIALILSVSTIGDFVSRILQLLFNVFFKIKHRYCVMFGILMTTIIRYILAFTNNLTVVQILLSSIGFFRSWIHVALPLAIAEQCIPSRFPAAFGLLMIIMCVFYMVIGSAIVFAIKSLQNDAFIVGLLASITGFVCLVWVIEMIYTKRKFRRSSDLR